MGFVSDFFDDQLGFDPGGGGIYDVARQIDGGAITDDILGMDPNGGGFISKYNAVAPLAAAYFTGGLTGLGDCGSSLGSDLFSALSGGAIDSELLTSALTDARITSAADASAFGSALSNSGWRQYLSSANAGIMGDVSTAGLFGPTAGLGDIYGTSSELGSLIG